MQRLAAMRRLADAGINAGVLMAPLLPGLSADRAQVERTVRAAADHGARFVGSGLLNLSPELRDYYFDFLAAEYPSLLDVTGGSTARSTLPSDTASGSRRACWRCSAWRASRSGRNRPAP